MDGTFQCRVTVPTAVQNIYTALQTYG